MQIKGLSSIKQTSFFTPPLKALSITKLVLGILSILSLSLSLSFAFLGKVKQAFATSAISTFFSKLYYFEKKESRACDKGSCDHEAQGRTHIPNLRIRIPEVKPHDLSE